MSFDMNPADEDEHGECRHEIERLRTTIEEQHKSHEIEVSYQRRRLEMYAAAESKNYWIWQGDGEDHLESLTCPILIRPEQLRSLIAERTRAEADDVRFRAIYHLPRPIRFAVMDSRTGDMVRDDLGAVRTWQFLKCAEAEASRLNSADLEHGGMLPRIEKWRKQTESEER